MSFIHDPYYDDLPTHNKIKPKQLLKIPYNFTTNGLAPLDEYIRLSPALNYLNTVGCLVVMMFSNNTLFYCDCDEHLEKVKKKWSESIRYFPLVLFEDHMNKLRRDKTAPVKKVPTKLKTLLDDLHNTGERCKVTIEHYEEVEDEKSFTNPKPEKSSKQRAEDILTLIKKRQNKKK